jgi:hypothetical protein
MMQLGRSNNFITRITMRDNNGTVVGETDAITFRGLLHLAHEDGLTSVRTELVQTPSEDNGRTAIVRAVVRTRKGVFSGIGDANAANVNRRIVAHLIRMAETRAIARAFRVAVNVGAVAVEELADDVAEHVQEERGQPHRAPQPTAMSPLEPRRSRGRDDHPLVATAGDRRAMSEEQRKLLFRLAYQLGESREGAATRVLAALGVERFEHATRVSAAHAIDRLKGEAAGVEQHERAAGAREAGDHG